MRFASATLAIFFLLISSPASAQDNSTGALHGQVTGPDAATISGARIELVETATGEQRIGVSDRAGRFTFDLLPAGDYSLTATYGHFAPRQQTGIHVDPARAAEVTVRLSLRAETVTVSGENPLVETQSSAVSSVIPEAAIENLPLNGRRFTDLALLVPGVTQDPRGLFASSNGDLAFGGLRGYHTLFYVDGSDNNNAFFAQARGRYRAPYQFSNDVVAEFTVSSNSYGAELGGAGGAVVNVVTKSGSNFYHGSASYYLRDRAFNARPPFLSFKPADRQQQFSFTFGGPLQRDRAFFFLGFDQHIFHVPTVVRFDNGSEVLTPVATNGVIPGDYEGSDQALVFAKTAQLDALAGEHPARQLGNAGFAKVGITLSPHQHLTARLSTSRYWGANNVFLNPSSPITNTAVSDNGEEDVATESAALELLSSLTAHVNSHLRLQYSRDLQSSSANSALPLQKITTVLDGIGRSNLLPRSTRERRLHLAETLSRSGGRHDLKFGGDLGLVWIRDFFPSQFAGEYVFDPIEVDPFTFVPQREGGLKLTPLRAYAHSVPRFYLQNFGAAISHPDTREYALFAQDSLRLGGHLTLNLGLRYDLQTFRSAGLVSNPLWPDSGRAPFNGHNFAPRLGFAYSTGGDRPLVLRGGAGTFYVLIPQIYNSAVEIQNGINSQSLFLDVVKFPGSAIFPQYPNPLVNCPPQAAVCLPPAGASGQLTATVSAFAHNFQTPYAEQANLSLEREVGGGVALEANYLFVRGVHLIRARDANLPKPVVLQYPVFDDTGRNFLGTFYRVDSFATWQFTPTFSCPFPPCINPLARPIAQLGTVNQFESEASSVYNGLTLSARKRMRRGLYFQISYTLAHAIDDNQDALVAGVPATVQNSANPSAERGASVTDQRHRLVVSWAAEPRPFHREHPQLAKAFDDWKLAGIVTFGSGRPVTARVTGDANQDGNGENDRLPGLPRNSLTGPDYATTDLRLSRRLHLGDRLRLELVAESFNLLNHQNKILGITDNGFETPGARFVLLTAKVKNQFYPAQFRNSASFLRATSAYAPRQVQLGVKLIW